MWPTYHLAPIPERDLQVDQLANQGAKRLHVLALERACNRVDCLEWRKRLDVDTGCDCKGAWRAVSIMSGSGRIRS